MTVDRAWRPRAGLKDAAVLAPLFVRDGVERLFLTKRREDLPDHPGQVAFPGGAREGDEDALTCALRESAEEVGIVPSTVEVIGRLPDRVSIAGFMVACFVGRIPDPRGLPFDAREVERVFDIPLADLRDPARWRYEDRVHATGTFRQVPFYEWEGPTLWGLTGMFVQDLAEATLPGFTGASRAARGT